MPDLIDVESFFTKLPDWAADDCDAGTAKALHRTWTAAQERYNKVGAVNLKFGEFLAAKGISTPLEEFALLIGFALAMSEPKDTDWAALKDALNEHAEAWTASQKAHAAIRKAGNAKSFCEATGVTDAPYPYIDPLSEPKRPGARGRSR